MEGIDKTASLWYNEEKYPNSLLGHPLRRSLAYYYLDYSVRIWLIWSFIRCSRESIQIKTVLVFLFELNTVIGEIMMKRQNYSQLRKEAWERYKVSRQGEEDRILREGVSLQTVGDRSMKWSVKTVGDAPEGGYPLFISLHGGGTDPTGQMNESQWVIMHERAINGTPAIYAAPRAIEDTWDCHSVEGAFPFYDDFLSHAILFWNVNPDRIYLTGYSAGGDGVYQIAPRMADRFAGADMSAGHPNGVSLMNLYNLPLMLQVGEMDRAYDRNRMTVRYAEYLGRLQAEAGGGYRHCCFVHAGKPHSACRDVRTAGEVVVADPYAWLLSTEAHPYSGGTVTARTDFVTELSQITREAIPDRVIWDNSVRAKLRKTDRFYWLALPKNAPDGIVEAVLDRKNNRISIPHCTLRATTLTILLNEEMVDLDRPVEVEIGGRTLRFTPEIDLALLEESTALGDPGCQYLAKIEILL